MMNDSVKQSQQNLIEAILNNPKVRMRNRVMVEKKLQTIAEGGTDKLMVISDFDHTLSRYHDSTGQKCWTTHGVFDAAAMKINSDLGARFAELKEKYLPIEFDPNMPIKEKTPHMEKWWRSAHEQIVKAKFRRQAIETFVRQSKIMLRDDADALIMSLDAFSVPLIIFSAGIGNVIEMFLNIRLGYMPKNIHILSNMMEFDDNGVVTSFKEPLIHTFCKNSSVIRREQFQEISGRCNILLMGDSLGDVHMDVGVVGETTSLKIGFLNFDYEALLGKYLEGYDIVLTDDQSMNIARLVLDLAHYRSFDEDLLRELPIRTISSTSTCHVEAAEEEEQMKMDEEKKPRAVVTNVKA